MCFRRITSDLFLLAVRTSYGRVIFADVKEMTECPGFVDSGVGHGDYLYRDGWDPLPGFLWKQVSAGDLSHKDAVDLWEANYAAELERISQAKRKKQLELDSLIAHQLQYGGTTEEESQEEDKEPPPKKTPQKKSSDVIMGTPGTTTVSTKKWDRVRLAQTALSKLGHRQPIDLIYSGEEEPTEVMLVPVQELKDMIRTVEKGQEKIHKQLTSLCKSTALPEPKGPITISTPVKSTLPVAKPVAGSKECPLCQKVLSTKLSLDRHISKHYGKSDYQCDVCNTAVKDLQSLREHKKIHDVKNFKCTQCKSVFGTQKLLTSHVERIHTKYTKEQRTCAHCKKTFGKIMSLRDHIPDCRKRDGYPGPYYCPDKKCVKSNSTGKFPEGYTRVKDLNAHMKKPH